MAGDSPPTLQQLTKLGAVPETLARDLLDELTRVGIVVQARENGRAAYALARDPASVRVTDIVAAVEHREEPEELPESQRDSRGERVSHILGELRRARRESEADVDLRTLAEG